MLEPEKQENLNSILENAARRFADKTAVLMGERRVSFARLNEDSNRFAHALISMGVKKGDRVAMIQASNPEFVAVFFGIMKAGGIAVPLDSRYVADELDRLFNDCRPRVLVVENPPLESLLPALPRFDSLEHVITFDPAYTGRFTDYHEILAKYPSSGIDVPVDPEDIAIISYTGGPTQKPHGVALSHYSVITEAVNSAYVFQQTDKDVLMQFALPMYHQFGLTSVLMASIYKGSTVVVVPGTGRSIDSFMEAVEREKGTLYMSVPYIYSLMINVARREGIRHDLSSLRLCISGGAPLEPVVINLFKELYGFTILDVWGQTETVSQATVAPIDGTGNIDSSGKPMPCWEIKIFDENENELPPGQEGEIVIRGPVMTGFYNKPEATARIIRNGWLHTGDIGWIDEDGFLFITGRKRRMLILKGQNIFPDDIEEVLAAHPGIAEVKVIGVIDIVRGETVKALVRSKPGETVTEQEIRQYCQGRMADYKLPREIEFVDVIPEEIPNWTRPKGVKAADIRLEGTG
ncbi:MAG: AMP-binding protein [Dehalococcoidales bacterium]|nr:AMP-binding protein [Dehalococcoidales bacterium]